ncbi:MAG: hypothetical protein KAX15_05605 [Candidatus Omnitrophica bacterium]|nr:hypothetical protein [Candidatus Omnitrophota bacterium]
MIEKCGFYQVCRKNYQKYQKITCFNPGLLLDEVGCQTMRGLKKQAKEK